MPSDMMQKPVATRIPLLERDQVSPEIAAVYDALLKQRGVVPNMFKTLAHTPALALGIAGFLKSLLGDSALPGWYKELIATRMSALHDSQYAISAHALSAKQKGANDEQIAAAKGDFQRGPFTESEKLGFVCADRLHHSGRDLDDDLFVRLKKVFSDAQIVELVVTAAAFEMFPRLVDGLRLPITPPPKSGP
jgi:AhpD family alkylhydroperoxidase